MTNVSYALLAKVMYRDGLKQLARCLDTIEEVLKNGWDGDFSASERIMCAVALIRPDMNPENLSFHESWSRLDDVQKAAVVGVWSNM